MRARGKGMLGLASAGNKRRMASGLGEGMGQQAEWREGGRE
jgi:hypothetical protein